MANEADKKLGLRGAIKLTAPLFAGFDDDVRGPDELWESAHLVANVSEQLREEIDRPKWDTERIRLLVADLEKAVG